jgi:hypothetical protein
MRNEVDLLLEWCSIRGSGSREQFARAATGMVPGSSDRVLARLELMGHIEVDWDRTGRWSVNPTVLALPEGSGGNAFVSGARNEGTLRTLELLRDSEGISLTIVPCDVMGPSTWFVGAPTVDRLEAVAGRLGGSVIVEPALELMNRWPSLDQVLEGARANFVPSGFGARRLNVRNLTFEPVDVKYANWPAGCFEQLSSGRRKYIFVDDDDVRYVCDRWVATHAEIRRQASADPALPSVVLWDKATNRLAVRSTAQLPTMWARAAALCSGIVPRRVEGQQWWDIYEGIELHMFGAFAKALDLKRISSDLSDLDKEDL